MKLFTLSSVTLMLLAVFLVSSPIVRVNSQPSGCPIFAGYRFYATKDRDGGDLGQFQNTLGKNDSLQLANTACNANPECNAFNTLAKTKKGVTEAALTDAVLDGTRCSGIYLKFATPDAASG